MSGYEALAAAVCDELVAKGKLKATPAFIRKDREAKIVKVFEAAKLDKDALGSKNGREVEVAVRTATQGEAWVDDVQNVLKGMLSTDAANDTTLKESDEMKALREKMVESAKVEFADGAPPPNPSGPGGKGRGGGDRGDDESYGNFGGGGGGRSGGGDRACYNCGQEGHLSRDCPEPRQDGGGGRSGGGGGGRACYNCGQEGHISRDCPEPRR